jgi:cephalosporin hydroxylase
VTLPTAHPEPRPAELALRVVFYELETTLAALRTATRRVLRRPSTETDGRFCRIESRPWLSELPWGRQFWKRIETAKTNDADLYPPPLHWKGAVLVKDPFDLAIYPMLIQELRPRTVIEIGSYAGGSATWIADLLEIFEIDGHVYSFDIDQSRIAVQHPRVTFMQGDANEPATFDPHLLASLPHPWLLLEDAHVNIANLLHHFDRFLVPGDYVVVEDAFDPSYYRDYVTFVLDAAGRYLVDTRYADLFGFNATWNVNGFLRKMEDQAAALD